MSAARPPKVIAAPMARPRRRRRRPARVRLAACRSASAVVPIVAVVVDVGQHDGFFMRSRAMNLHLQGVGDENALLRRNRQPIDQGRRHRSATTPACVMDQTATTLVISAATGKAKGLRTGTGTRPCSPSAYHRRPVRGLLGLLDPDRPSAASGAWSSACSPCSPPGARSRRSPAVAAAATRRRRALRLRHRHPAAARDGSPGSAARHCSPILKDLLYDYTTTGAW